MIEGFLYSILDDDKKLYPSFKTEEKGDKVAHFGHRSQEKVLTLYLTEPADWHFALSIVEYPIAPKVILKWTDQ